jgi:leader peptidase (prepilin peptidase)/N-methyltransferase
MGDVKLLAMIGAFLGWQAVLPVVFIGSVVGTAIGIPFMLLKGGDGKFAIPFGPFLSLGAIVHLFWWSQMLDWYITTFFPTM